jgi:hypothetical protein
MPCIAKDAVACCRESCCSRQLAHEQATTLGYLVSRPEQRTTLQSWAKARSQPQCWCSEPKLFCWLPMGLKIRRSRRACAFRVRPCNCEDSDSVELLHHHRFNSIRQNGTATSLEYSWSKTSTLRCSPGKRLPESLPRLRSKIDALQFELCRRNRTSDNRINPGQFCFVYAITLIRGESCSLYPTPIETLFEKCHSRTGLANTP